MMVYREDTDSGNHIVTFAAMNDDLWHYEWIRGTVNMELIWCQDVLDWLKDYAVAEFNMPLYSVRGYDGMFPEIHFYRKNLATLFMLRFK